VAVDFELAARGAWSKRICLPFYKVAHLVAD
jgi:hypothetical protein